MALPSPGRELVNVQQALARASVTRRTLYTWMRTGKVEWIRTAGGSRRIYADTLFKPAAAAEAFKAKFHRYGAGEGPV